LNRKRLFVRLVMSVAVLAIITAFVAGCTAGTTEGGGGDTPTGTNVLLWAITSRMPGNQPQDVRFMRSSVASSSTVSSANPRTIRFPDGRTFSYLVTSGGVSANNYFIGNSNVNYGFISDPLSETNQRQLNYDLEYPETLDGEYVVTLNSLSKSVEYPQGNYMGYISQGDVQFGSGQTTLQSTGDAVILLNQYNPNYRYFCRIYNSRLDHSVFDNYWTSADVRNISWTNSDSLSDFILNRTIAPIGGTVRFDIPGGVLAADSSSILTIWAFDTTAVEADGSGNFNSFTFAVSELRWELMVQ